jgi:hypothetical protein
MLPLTLLLSLSLAEVTAPVLVAVGTEGLPDRDRDAVVAHIVGEVEGAGVVPTSLPPGVVTPACAADAACARNLFAGGPAARLLVVDVLRAGSRASIAARVVDREGRTIAEHAGVVPMAKLVAGKTPVLPDNVLGALVVAVTPPPSTMAMTPTPTTTTTTPTTPTTPAPTTSTTPTPAPATPSPTAGLDPGMPALLGVGATAVGALFLIGGTAAALGQNAVRLDPNADGDARADTAVAIPLSLGVAALGAVGVGVGVWLLVGSGDDSDAAAVVAGG